MISSNFCPLTGELPVDQDKDPTAEPSDTDSQKPKEKEGTETTRSSLKAL